jgi:hypothetical protein
LTIKPGVILDKDHIVLHFANLVELQKISSFVDYSSTGFIFEMPVRLQRLSKQQLLVAHACNPSYSGGRDQEDSDLKPVWANSS